MTREIVLADFFPGCGGTVRGMADAGVCAHPSLGRSPSCVRPAEQRPAGLGAAYASDWQG